MTVEEEYTYSWVEVMGYQSEISGAMTRELYYMIVASYFEGFFKVVRHEVDREDAKWHIRMIGTYHHAGFSAIAKGNP